MAAIVTAVLDACVLYPASLRDLLVELAYRRVIEGRWTAEIHQEWMRNLLTNRPDLDPEKLGRTRASMDRVRGCLVTGHMALVPALTLPDPDDRHVLAAAINGNANVIVTFNLKDFPPNALHKYLKEAQHPDGFLFGVLNADEGGFCTAAKAVRRRLRNPPKTAEDYVLALEEQGLTRTAARLRDLIDLI